jgi:NTE family protein
MAEIARISMAPIARDEEVAANVPAEEGQLTDDVGLALSGGGFRAMLFHAGALWRLNQSGVLENLDRISSVSGGSIISGLLGLRWKDLDFVEGVARRYEDLVVAPVMDFASETIDVGSILRGVLLPGSVSSRVSSRYRQLYGKTTLQDLPGDGEGPRFVINATNLQSGVLWRFTRPYMADYKVGMVRDPKVSLSDAVAASSAFPPFLSPFTLKVKKSAFTAESKSWSLAKRLQGKKVTLSDGGVYDNLGLQTVFDRYQTVLVSDGGAPFDVQDRVAKNWLMHTVRVLLTVQRQVGALRKNQLIEAYRLEENNELHRFGSYWGIGSWVSSYELNDPIEVDQAVADNIAAIPTRLAKISEKQQKQLINWGYVICDTALRKWVLTDDEKPNRLPFPDFPLA